MLLLIQYTLIFASVLLLVALGGCISEHSGIINLGLEGIMVVGALGGALVMKNFYTLPPALMVILALLAAANVTVFETKDAAVKAVSDGRSLKINN